jgi:hypothetical protein
MPKKHWKKQQESNPEPEPLPLEPTHTPFQRPQYAASERGVLRGYKDSVRVRPGVIELHPDRTR